MGESVGYPPQPNVPPVRRIYSRTYRVWAHVLLWTPIAITVTGVVGGLGLFAVADADPTYGSSGLGYLGLVVWGALTVGSPVLLGSFSFADTPTTAGKHTYVIQLVGNSATEPAKTTHVVVVSQPSV
ncbi:hypothetical protein [Nonomuraea sp. KM88]|uniref:hypothetical protein n=1 Tax=Nonomuraea sp. KM88 TaxID=3457427 RepID=UPI003FCD0934